MCYGPSESFGLTIFNTKEQAAGSQNSPPILFSSSSLISLSTFFLIFFSPPLSLLFLIQHLFNLYRIPNKYSTNVHPIYLCPEQFLCLHSLFAFLCVSLYYFLYLFILLFFLHLLWIFFLFWLLIIISKVFISLSNCFNFFSHLIFCFGKFFSCNTYRSIHVHCLYFSDDFTFSIFYIS